MLDRQWLNRLYLLTAIRRERGVVVMMDKQVEELFAVNGLPTYEQISTSSPLRCMNTKHGPLTTSALGMHR
jgi:hypothetical protein